MTYGYFYMKILDINYNKIETFYNTIETFYKMLNIDNKTLDIDAKSLYNFKYFSLIDD
jgi:hypothetical protein